VGVILVAGRIARTFAMGGSGFHRKKCEIPPWGSIEFVFNSIVVEYHTQKWIEYGNLLAQ